MDAKSDVGNSIEHVQGLSLDQILQEEKVTFIKLDIEGAELKALQGMKNIIIKYRPLLAVCIYHKAEDIVEIPGYIKTLVPDYKFYIRSYHMDYTEHVLYAIIE